MIDSISKILDIYSITKEIANLDTHIARQVRDLRERRGLSLDALAARCAVSRSMISRIERGESSPTAVLLEKLATGLGVALASLFDMPRASAAPVSRRSEQTLWRDPESGYIRRNISPVGCATPIQIVEVRFPARARVAYETSTRDVHVDQQVWVLDGRIDIRVGNDQHRLHAGDCLAMVLDRPIVFHNSSRRPARYAVVLATLSR